MHRQHSLQPFSRHYSHSTHSFLDLMDVQDVASSALEQPVPRRKADAALFPTLSAVPSPSRPSTPVLGVSTQLPKTQIILAEPHLTPMISLLKAYKLVHSLNLLHTVTFVTVQEYLFLLRGICKIMAKHLGRKAMFYLAAAVSDFFIPQQRMSEHKIQSGKGSLIIEMDQVPKILKPLVQDWGSETYVVSFKLETDDNLLVPKARQALERYGHQLVIGNDLHRRKQEVVFVSSAANEEWIRLDEQQVHAGREIEELIVAKLVKFHAAWIEQEGTQAVSRL